MQNTKKEPHFPFTTDHQTLANIQNCSLENTAPVSLAPAICFTRKWFNDKALTMKIEIDYSAFDEDFTEIFTPLLNEFGFVEVDLLTEAYTKHFENEHWGLIISMLLEFPRVGAGFVFLGPENEYAKPSLLQAMIPFTDEDERAFYEKFNSDDLIDYRNQMIFVEKILHRFYRKILSGEITFKDYQNFKDKQTQS